MQTKLHLVLDPKCYIQSLTYMFINKEECAVSDTSVLLVHKCNEIFPEEFVDSIPEGDWLIPYEAVKKMNTKGATYLIKSDQILITIKGAVTMFPITKNGTDGLRYPQFKQVIPTEYNGQLNSICLNPELLLNLAQAIDPDYVGVILKWSDGEHAMSVRAKNSIAKNYKAILMPMKVM